MDEKVFSNLDAIKKESGDADAVELLWVTCTKTGNTGKIHTKRPHHHSFFELHAVLEGSKCYVIEGDDRELEIKAGEILIIPPEKRHFPRRHSEGSVRFSAAFSIPEKSIFAYFLEEDSCKVISDGRFDEFVSYCINEAKAPCRLSYDLINNKLFEQLCFFYRSHVGEKEKEQGVSAFDIRVLKAKEYVQRAIGTSFSCGAVAAQCGISEQQLNRLFRRYENCSLLAYIHKEKVAKAQELLTTTEMSLRQISEELDFQNEYYFNTFFKRESGMTPGDYRRSFPSFRPKKEK